MRKTQRDSIPNDRARSGCSRKSKPQRVAGTAIFLTNHRRHRAVVVDAQLEAQQGAARTRADHVGEDGGDAARAHLEDAYEIENDFAPDFSRRLTLHYGYMESPRIPVRACDSCASRGLKFDIMTTSFFLGRRTIKTSPNSGMPLWQDRLFVALSKQAANATDFFAIPSERVVELGAQITV